MEMTMTTMMIPLSMVMAMAMMVDNDEEERKGAFKVSCRTLYDEEQKINAAHKQQ